MGTAGPRQWRVLIVDDEENLNWSLVNSLRKDAYSADGATTGEEAVRLLAAQNYDIVISDVKMPGMDGFELLQWLRANRPQARVVMMTAFGSPTERGEAVRGGAIAYLEKPFDLRALKEQLRRMTSPSSAAGAATASQADGYDLLEVARVVNLARRDIALRVESAGRAGRFRFAGGELIWAESGELQGDDAFVALTVSSVGRAQPEQWDGRSARNVTQPLSRLIPLVLSQRDHAARGEAPGPAKHATPRPSAPTASPAEPAAAPRAASAPDQPPVSPAPGMGVSAASAPAPATQTAGMGTIEPSAGTAPVARLTTEQLAAVQTAVGSLAGELPQSAGVAFLRPDGTVVTQRWNGERQEPPNGALLHLAACAQSALRALLIAGWGDLGHVEVASRERNLLLCRYGRGDRAGVLVLAVPQNEELERVRELLANTGAALNAALH